MYQSLSFLSYPEILTHSSNSVTKLTDRKIRWIMREKMKEIHRTKGEKALRLWCKGAF
jgi:hypothetical protein